MPFDTLLHRLVDEGDDEACSHLVRRVPAGEPATLFRDLTSPLVAAWARGSRVFSCWTHTPGRGFDVRVGGTRGFPAAPTTADPREPPPILFPPGARADSEGPAAQRLSEVLGGYGIWRRVGGFVERRREAGDAGDPGTLEDHAAFLSHLSFALLCVAVPVSREAVVHRKSELAARLLESQRGGDRGAADRVTAALTAEVEEATIAEAAGLWRVHLFAGSDSSDGVNQIAAIWGASAAAPSQAVYRLAPVGEPQALPETAAGVQDRGEALTLASPFHAGSGFLSVVCRPPVVEVPGVEARATNPFDVAVGTTRTRDQDEEIDIGDVLDRARAPIGQLRVGLDTLAMHTFVHGATGAGKSQATRWMLTQLSRAGIPWIVLEPAKSEYASGMTERLAEIRHELRDPALADVYVIRPGDGDATPVSLNLLEPEPGFHYQAHLDAVVDLLVAVFDAEPPFPQILTQAVNRSAVAAGWDPALSRPLERVARIGGGMQPPYPDVGDLVRECHAVIEEKGYAQDVVRNLRAFLDMRLRTLTTGSKRSAFGAGYPLSMPKVLGKNVVLELQDLGTDADRALFMGLFLARLNQAVRLRKRTDAPVQNVVCIEEAHRLLRNAETLTPAARRAVESFTDMLAEVRARGVALMVAEQIPSKISTDVIKNTALKCMGRTPARDDREVVGAAMGLTEEQSEEVVAFRPGEFAVHADGYDRPFLVRFKHKPEHGGARARDPEALVNELPPWYGSVVLKQRDVALAGQIAAEPALSVFCELVVIAHLTGYPHPTVRPDMRATMLNDLPTDAPAVRAAIAHAVAQAAQARSSVFGRYLLPGLATAAAEECERALTDPRRRPLDRRWLSRPFQYNVISGKLASHDEEGPHPDTRRWVEEWGLDFLDQTTAEAQARALARLLQDSVADYGVALHGRTRPGVVEALAAEAWPSDLARGYRAVTRFAANPRTIAVLLEALATYPAQPAAGSSAGS